MALEKIYYIWVIIPNLYVTPTFRNHLIEIIFLLHYNKNSFFWKFTLAVYRNSYVKRLHLHCIESTKNIKKILYLSYNP